MQRRLLHPISIMCIRLPLSFLQTLTLTTSSSQTCIVSPLLSLLSCSQTWSKDPSLPSLITQTLVQSPSPSHLSSLFLSPSLSPQISLSFFHYLSLHFPSLLSLHYRLALLQSLAKSQYFFLVRYILTSTIASVSNSKEDLLLLLSFMISIQKESQFRPSIRCTNTLLMALSRFSMIKEMRDLFDKLNIGEIFGKPNLHTYNIMINAHCKDGLLSDAKLYLGFLLQANLLPDTHTYTSFIMGYCKDDKLDNACKVFVLMPYMGCLRNMFSYTVLLQGLCDTGRVKQAVSIFSSMRDDKIDRDVQVYTILIHGFCKVGSVDDARILLGDMYKNGLVPNVVTYNALIDGYCKKGNLDLAMRLLRKMELTDLCKPNSRTYSELICGFCRERKVDKAMALYNKMVQVGLTPNVVTFSTLIQGQCEHGSIESAFRLLVLMESIGLVPNDWTWSILINALCKHERVEEAISLFGSLLEKGIKGNKVVYTALIDGLCKSEKTELSFRWLEKMILGGIMPDLYTYNSILDGLCREKRVNEAIGVLNDMSNKGVQPDVLSYTILIDELVRDRRTSDAEKLFGEMLELGIAPDTCIYTVFVQSCCFEGRMEAAEKLLTQMRANGVFPNLVTYNTLINGYETWGLTSKTLSTFASMINDSIEPNAETYGSLIRHLVRRKGADNSVIKADVDVWKIVDLETIEELLEVMAKLGVRLNISAYEILVSCLCKVDRIEEAKYLVSKLEKETDNQVPSEDIYTSLVDCLCRLKKVTEAVEYVNLMEKYGYVPMLESYKRVICLLCETGQLKEGISVFCGLLTKGYNCDEIAWKIIFEGLLSENHEEFGSKLLTIMEERGYKTGTLAYSKMLEQFGNQFHKGGQLHIPNLQKGLKWYFKGPNGKNSDTLRTICVIHKENQMLVDEGFFGLFSQFHLLVLVIIGIAGYSVQSTFTSTLRSSLVERSAETISVGYFYIQVIRATPFKRAALKALSKAITEDEVIYIRSQYDLLEPSKDG